MKQHKSFSRRKFFAIGATSFAALIGHKAVAQNPNQQDARLAAASADNKNLHNKTPIQFTSVVQMQQATNLTVGDVVNTISYYDVGNSSTIGGGNQYLIVKDNHLKIDNGAVIKLKNGLQAKALFANEQIQIEQFGVISGENLSESQIKRNGQAMNLAHALGKVVHYAGKNYLFNSLTINQGGIQGQVGTKLTATNTDSAINIEGAQISQIQLNNFTLTSRHPNQTTGIKTTNNDNKVNLRVSQVAFINLKQGLALNDGNQLTINNNQFNQMSQSAITISGVIQDLNISHNTIIDGNYGIQLLPSSSHMMANINSNTISNQNTSAIYLATATTQNKNQAQSAGLLNINQNQIVVQQGAAIVITPQQTLKDLSINNNQINAATDKQIAQGVIAIHNSQNFIVNNNIINCQQGKGYRGIYISEDCNSGILNANHVMLPQNGHTLNLSKTTTQV